MDATFVHNVIFRNRLHESGGQAFQDVFNQLMSFAYESYVSVAPWGSQGDRGNDGYVATEQRYFQLYAPTSAFKPVDVLTACHKAEEDFSKLLSTKTALRRWHFVLNDRFKGLPEPLVPVHEAILADHPQLDECYPIGTQHLLKKFIGLPANQQESIIGGVPSNVPTNLDLSSLGDLLVDLANSKDSLVIGGIKPPAMFEAKAVFNGFSDDAKSLLLNYARQSHIVDKFLDARDTWWRQTVAEDIRSRYMSLKDELSGDEKLLQLVDALMPAIAGSPPAEPSGSEVEFSR
ncbi:ABC-three component system protein [Dyella sp. ASV21]|uniref:ABC-three component system protein n=1 Tax=Dyella sp. ASV21 TaxID=2795114 RepID=UPI0018EB47B7|nr:ABC-three component system protein [Dyella sp. ASV21]